MVQVPRRGGPRIRPGLHNLHCLTASHCSQHRGSQFKLTWHNLMRNVTEPTGNSLQHCFENITCARLWGHRRYLVSGQWGTSDCDASRPIECLGRTRHLLGWRRRPVCPRSLGKAYQQQSGAHTYIYIYMSKSPMYILMCLQFRPEDKSTTSGAARNNAAGRPQQQQIL